MVVARPRRPWPTPRAPRAAPRSTRPAASSRSAAPRRSTRAGNRPAARRRAWFDPRHAHRRPADRRPARQEGVEVAFGLPGVHNLALWEALRASPIRLVGVRHEQTAAYAADGYARATGRLGVALTTTGPGAANTLGAVGEAWASRSPVLVIATDIPSTLRRPGVYRGVLHETTDQAAMFAPVTKATTGRCGRTRSPGGAGACATRHAPPRRPVYLESRPTCWRAELPDERIVDAAARARATPRRLDGGAVGALDRGRAAAAVGRRRRARGGRRGRAAGRAARRAGADDLRRRRGAAPGAPVPGRACRRTSRRRARCGTRPTSSSRSAPTSTACRPRTSRCRSRRS